MSRVCFFVFVILFFVCQPLAFADDTYNFVFQKSPGKPVQVKSAEQKLLRSPKKNKIEKRDSHSYEGEDSHYVAKSVSHLKKNERNWSFRAGVGYIYGYTSDQHGSSATYLLGLNYKVNKYLDIETAHQLPRGDEYQTFGYSKWGVSAIGVSVTPINITLFGRPVLAISIMGGATFDGNLETAPYLGARLGLRFSEKLAAHLATRSSFGSTFNNARSVQSELSLVYSW